MLSAECIQGTQITSRRGR